MTTTSQWVSLTCDLFIFRDNALLKEKLEEMSEKRHWNSARFAHTKAEQTKNRALFQLLKERALYIVYILFKATIHLKMKDDVSSTHLHMETTKFYLSHL